MTPRAILLKLQLFFTLDSLRVKKIVMCIYFRSPTGSGCIWSTTMNRFWSPYPSISLKPSMHCMILTCWHEQPADIRPDFLFPRTSFSLQVLGEQWPIICSGTTVRRSDMSEILLCPQRFSQWKQNLELIEASLSAPVQNNKSPWPCVAGMKIRRWARLRCGNSLNSCSRWLLQLHGTSYF